jgi:hypothetical protein
MLRTRLACAALIVVSTLPGCRIFRHDGGPGLLERCRAKRGLTAEPVSYPMTSEGAFPATTMISGPVISGPPIMQPAPYFPQGGIPPQNIPQPNGGTLPPPTGQVPNKMPPSGGGAGIKENPGKEFELEKRTGPALAVPVSGER